MLATLTRNAMLDTLGSLAANASLHTDDPGATGAYEVPGCARQPLFWAPAEGTVKRSNVDLVFQVPARTTIRFVGYWTPTGGFVGSRPIESQTYATGGTWSIPAGAVEESLT